MRIAIHQPNFMPWRGFFEKMRLADLFVYLDDAQFSKGSYQNRVEIADSSGQRVWLTVPVKSASRFMQPMNEVEIVDPAALLGRHTSRLRACYRSAPHFTQIYGELVPIYERGHRNLVDLNMDILEWMRGKLKIQTPCVLASSLAATGRSTERLLSIIHAVGADEYIAGSGAAGYSDPAVFRRAGIAEVTVEHEIWSARMNRPMSASVLDSLFWSGVEE